MAPTTTNLIHGNGVSNGNTEAAALCWPSRNDIESKSKKEGTGCILQDYHHHHPSPCDKAEEAEEAAADQKKKKHSDAALLSRSDMTAFEKAV